MCVSNSLNTKNTVKGAVHDVCVNCLSIKIVNAYRALLNFRQLKKHLDWNIPQNLLSSLSYPSLFKCHGRQAKQGKVKQPELKKKAVVIGVRPLVR